MSQLNRRARAVLYAVVTEFIATGEPIGSVTLTRKYDFDVSSATIRAVLADLEELGYLAQPHTSAGRVPTELAYRLFIDALMKVRELSPDDSAKIQERFGELRPGADIVRETGKLLSELTGAAAVLVRPRVETRTLLKLRFIPTRPYELLGVLVMSDGTVENRFLSVEQPFTPVELERLHRLLEEVAEGRTLGELRQHLGALLEERRGELAALHGLGATLVSAAIDGAGGGAEVIVEGRARLLEHRDLRDAEQRGELMRILEDGGRLMTLLDRTLDSARVQVFLGHDTQEAVGFPISVVAAPYSNELGRPGGAVGIIGPTRMDYATLVPLVEATAGAMSQALARGREPRGED